LSFDYFPSLMEWAVTAGTVGLAILGYLLGIDYLPLFPKSTKEA
jgi:Ni/Fe-hydrogenase subunit HybB-like protein